MGVKRKRAAKPKTDSIIEVVDLVKTYPTKVPTLALRGVSFDIKEGEFVSLMGRSGSGKSTLLHQLGLLDTPTSGSLRIDGADVLHLDDNERTRFRLKNLGYIFQEYALIAEFTALENVLLPAFALEGDHDREHACKLLSLVGLGDRLDHYPSELSGGEQQRVAIARSLVNKPKILYADEPTANLDSENAKRILELFVQLNEELNQTILMVTHEPEDRKYVDRIIWLKDGLLAKEE